MNVDGKSDGPVVVTKPPNEVAAAAATEEGVERRGLAKGKASKTNASRTQCRTHDAPSGLQRLREAARKDRKTRFTALLHHVTVERLRTAYLALERDAAPGVDGVTWESYQVDLEARLTDLHDRVHRGAYRAKPTRRVTIAKADGSARHLGVTTLEDKIVQRALVEVLNAIYEEDFLGFSYGFRPGRSQHQALDALSVGLTKKKVSWVLDADIRGFFDALDHEWMVRFIEHRIGDRRVVRLIQKWLSAGVMIDGKRHVADRGSPQGATISPLLANVYLHYVFDLWTAQWRRRHARGDMIVVRYADDIVLVQIGDATGYALAFDDGGGSYSYEKVFPIADVIPTGNTGNRVDLADVKWWANITTGVMSNDNADAFRIQCGDKGRSVLRSEFYDATKPDGNAVGGTFTGVSATSTCRVTLGSNWHGYDLFSYNPAVVDLTLDAIRYERPGVCVP